MRAAVYLRQSLDASGEGLAVDRQRKACLDLCAQKGWTPAEYVDNSVSASGRKPRPSYLRMLDDIRDGAIDAVVVWDLDRLHRQPAELETFIDLADRHSLALATVTGDTDLSTDNGRLFARIKGAVARAEVERKSARQKAAHEQRAADGKPWSTRRPFGFEADAITHHPVEAPILRQVYADILAGVSQSSIARRLNETGFPSTLGNPWRQSSLRQVIINPRNAGLRARHGEIVGPANWDPIVGEDTWRSAVAIVTSHPGAGKPRGGLHLLSGCVTCGPCGAKLHVSYPSGVRAYACPKCFRVSRNAERLEEYATRLIVRRLSEPNARDLLVDDTRPDSAALQAEADTLRRRLEHIAEDYADGDLTQLEWKRARDRVKARLTVVEQTMVHTGRAAALGPFILADDPEAAWTSATVDRQRALLNVFLQLTVQPTRQGSRFNPGDIEVHWLL